MGNKLVISTESAIISIESSPEISVESFPSSTGGNGSLRMFPSAEAALNSTEMKTLISEIKGWIKRNPKYKIASEQEAKENKQSGWNSFFTYNRKMAAKNATKLEYKTIDGVLLSVFHYVYGHKAHIEVFCPIVKNNKGQKITFKKVFTAKYDASSN